jgi:hypothetical protein
LVEKLTVSESKDENAEKEQAPAAADDKKDVKE